MYSPREAGRVEDEVVSIEFDDPPLPQNNLSQPPEPEPQLQQIVLQQLNHNEEEEPDAQAQVSPQGQQENKGEEEAGGQAPPLSFSVGDTIKHWIITAKIGAGAFGETFTAIDAVDLAELGIDVETIRHAHALKVENDEKSNAALGEKEKELIRLQKTAKNCTNEDEQWEIEQEEKRLFKEIDELASADRPSLFAHSLEQLFPQMPQLYSDKFTFPPEVCIKIERAEKKNVLRFELLSLKRAQECNQVVRYISSGREGDANYVVMEKMGPNLAELRRRAPRQVFDIYSTLRIGVSCIDALEGIHTLGLIHRDIKPSNFVVGMDSLSLSTCFLVDFGLAKRYRRSNGDVKPPRAEAGFRGTSRYASLASHQQKDLGRVDDCWSLLFMLVEMATGTLPWRKSKVKEEIGRIKEEVIFGGQSSLVRNMPREFGPFLKHLCELRFESRPDYDHLKELLLWSIERRGYDYPSKPMEHFRHYSALLAQREANKAAFNAQHATTSALSISFSLQTEHLPSQQAEDFEMLEMQPSTKNQERAPSENPLASYTDNPKGSKPQFELSSKIQFVVEQPEGIENMEPLVIIPTVDEEPQEPLPQSPPPPAPNLHQRPGKRQKKEKTKCSCSCVML